MEERIEELIERARVLLGWPTTRKIVELAQRFPEEAWWRYAVESLERAERPNEAYLISCLRTAQAEGRRKAAAELGPYPAGFGERECPWYRGVYCPRSRECKGWEYCGKSQGWFLKALREANEGDTKKSPPRRAPH